MRGLAFYTLSFSLVLATFVLMGGQASGFGGDGNFSFNDYGGGSTGGQCQNLVDDNGNAEPGASGQRGDDVGCVLPLADVIDGQVVDDTEGSVWDTDLSQTIGPGNQDLMMKGELHRGSWSYETLAGNLPQNGISGTTEDKSSSGSKPIEERHLEQVPDESGNWGNSEVDTKEYDESYSDITPATDVKDDRFIFYPHNYDGATAWGDGIENDGWDSSTPKGDSAGSEYNRPNSEGRRDYGRIYEKYHEKSPYGTDPPGSASCGCSDSGFTNGPVYYASGDKVVKETEVCDSNGNCDCTLTPSGLSCDTDYTEDTDKSRHNCNQHNTVDGGTASGGMRNDQAATYTEFTAYEDSGSYDKAWCGYEFTTTVDADGPQGQGNGWIVVENRDADDDWTDENFRYSIKGKEDHAGDNQGQAFKKAYMEGSQQNYDLTNEITNSDLECPETREVCLMYVDFYTKNSGWSTTDDGGWKDAIDYKIRHTLVPEDSYSVCKNINRIHSDIPHDQANAVGQDYEQLVNCDYLRDESPVSALDNSCGNKQYERLVSVEGPQVNADAWDQFPAYQQECVTYDSNPDDFNRNQAPDEDASDYPEAGPDSSSSELDKEWINSVQLATLNKDSREDISDGYQDFSSSWADVRNNQNYRMEVSLSTDSGQDMHVRAWFDWNHDNDFNDAADQSVDLGSCDFEGCVLSSDFNLNADSDKLGQTLMRVSMRQGSDPTPTNTGWNRGETEDYTVYVTESGQASLRKGACVLDGKVYPEGSVEDVGNDKQGQFTGFEKTDSPDEEVCLDIDPDRSWQTTADDSLPNDIDADSNDNGGEWWDIDSQRATYYLRNNVVDSREYIQYWENNPDLNADPSTGVTGYHKKPGFALEDDCYLYGDTGRTITCEDLSNTEISWNSTLNDGGVNGFGNTPVYAQFFEGALGDDDFGNLHNRVQSGGGTGHEITEGSETKKTVTYQYQWNDGTHEDTYATDPNNYPYSTSRLTSTESRNSADVNGQMMGVDVYGTYTSDIIEKTPERNFAYMNLTYDFSRGDHPVRVKISETADMSTNVVTREFWLNATDSKESIDLGTSEDHQYLQFTIGMSNAELPSQTSFVIDDTGSMGGQIDGIKSNVKSFFRGLGANAEGSVVTFKDSPEKDQGFTSSESTIESTVDSISANSGGDCKEDADGGLTKSKNDLTWDAGFGKVVILVVGAGVHSPSDIRDIANEFSRDGYSVYSVTDGLGCNSNNGADAVTDYLPDTTGGNHYSFGTDWSNILDDVQTQLQKLPLTTEVERVSVTAKSPPAPGAVNTQDREPDILNQPGHPEELDNLENSNINEEDDEWAYTPSLDWAVANNGSAWPPGKCYGTPREQGVDKWKNNSVYANSYARGYRNVYSGGLNEDAPASPETDGDWINPDNDEESVITGGVTCDLTGHDWGYAVQNSTNTGIEAHHGSDYDRKGDPSSPGTENVDEEIPVAITVDSDDFAWDMDSHHPRDPKTNLSQWKDACGDDRNEYLIREHAAKTGGEYNPDLNRDNIYACADRPTDCVVDGNVYSEGMVKDVSDVDDEYSSQSNDQEICLDINDELPGGEWWDVDNESIRKHIIDYSGQKTGSADDPYLFTRGQDIDVNDPGNITWHTGDKNGANEVNVTPYNPIGQITDYGSYDTGYALEDDCDRVVDCDDTGAPENTGQPDEAQRGYPGLVYSPFKIEKGGDRVKSDDYSTGLEYPIRMWVDGSYTHGSHNDQMFENTDNVNFDSSTYGPTSNPEWTHTGSWPTDSLNDSRIDRREDTWSISNLPYDAVGPTGASYTTGRCHGKKPPKYSEGWVYKNQTVMANSYAKREHLNSDSWKEGNWVNPDTTERTVSRGGLTCDLNSTDWGIGYDNGAGSSLNIYRGSAREYGYNLTDRHVVSGPITFDDGRAPLGEQTAAHDLTQYPSACGDDQNEFLIREQYSSYHGGEIYPNLTHRDNIYVCADRISDCAYNGSVYTQGQTTDITSNSPSHTTPETGENLPDEEICLDLNKSTPGGEWYDKDQNLATQNRIETLENTFNVTERTSVSNNAFTVSGRVVGVNFIAATPSSRGTVEMAGYQDNTIGQNGQFSFGANGTKNKTYVLKFSQSGNLEAQKTLVIPDTGEDLDGIQISPELTYDGSEVWSDMEEFSDHDFDRNKYHSRYNSTDWRSQTSRYDRTDLAYFNRTGEYYSPPSPRENVRERQKRYYSPEGYATEDDCGPLLSKSSTGPCGDVGDDTQHQSWFSAGNFTGMAP